MFSHEQLVKQAFQRYKAASSRSASPWVVKKTKSRTYGEIVDATWESPIGTYEWTSVENATLFRPSRAYEGIVDDIDMPAESHPTVEDGQAWAHAHYELNKAKAPYEHPELEAMRADAASIAKALQTMFRRKPVVSEDLRMSRNVITIDTRVKVPMTATLLDDTIDALGKRLNLRFKKGRRSRPRSFPDPVEGEANFEGRLNGRLVEGILSYMSGELFSVTMYIQG